MMRLRIKLARLFFNWSVWLAPQPEQTKEYKSLPLELQIPHDAVVETTLEPLAWHPDQKGGIVVAEPILMTLDRRNKQ